jgi:hypothetical protein
VEEVEGDTRLEGGKMTQQRTEFRFCVGSKQGRRSTVWKIYSNKNDIYLSSRMMGSDMKVSLHDSGENQWSLTSDWVLRNVHKDIRNRERHIVKWNRDEFEKGKAQHLFRIIIPESELRQILSRENLSKVHWIDSPPTGFAKIIECYLTPPVTATLNESQFPFPKLYSFQIPKRNCFVILMRDERVSAADNQELMNLKINTLALAEREGIELRPAFRGVGFVHDSSGAKGFVEFVPLTRSAHGYKK